MAERALRITELLEQPPRHDVAQFSAMQRDEVSEVAKRFAAYIARATPRTESGRSLQQALSHWDGAMRARDRAPLLYSAWLRELGPAIFGDEIGRENLLLFPRPRTAFLLWVLENDDAEWCDDITTAGRESCLDAVAGALDNAAASVPHGVWGDWHIAHFEHPLMSSIPLLGGLYSISQPVGGDTTTINMTRLEPSPSFASDFGAAYRAVYDLADLDRSRYMLAPGQSGHPLSPYYRNLVHAWAAGEAFEIRGRGPGEPPQNAVHTLTLLPMRD
jgi:penicillin amidase